MTVGTFFVAFRYFTNGVLAYIIILSSFRSHDSTTPIFLPDANLKALILRLFARGKLIDWLPEDSRWTDFAFAVKNRDPFERVPSINEQFVVEDTWNLLLAIFFFCKNAAAHFLEYVEALLVRCHSWTICETQCVVGWPNALVYIRYRWLRQLLLSHRHCVLGLVDSVDKSLVRRKSIVPVGSLIGDRAIRHIGVGLMALYGGYIA